MANFVLESFSLTHAAILDGITPGDGSDIFGVRTGSLDLDMENFTNTADDSVVSVANWFNQAVLTIESGYISFDILSLLMGVDFTTSGDVESGESWDIPLWPFSSFMCDAHPVLLRTAARAADGSVGTLDFILYKVQFDPIQFDGPSYKNGLSVSYTGHALMSDTNEVGTFLPEPQVGRLVYGAAAAPVVVIPPPSDDILVDNTDGTYSLTSTDLTDNGDGTYTYTSGHATDNGDGTATITV